MRRFCCTATAVLLCVLLACCRIVASTHTLLILDSSVSPGNVACDINDAGQVIGNNAHDAFIWDAAKGYRIIPNMSQVHSINNNGMVVGNYSIFARVWTEADGFTNLPGYDNFNADARGVNDNGDVAGGVFRGSEFYSRASAWNSTGGIKMINNFESDDHSGVFSINNANLAVGWAAVDGPIRGAIWDASGNRTLLNAEGNGSCYVLDVNNRGEAVGWAERVDPATNAHNATAFIWDAVKGMRYLGTLDGGLTSCAYGINDLGQVVGFSTKNGNFASRAFVWDETSGMRSLGDFESEARAINNLGQIVGSYMPDPSVSFEPIAVLWQPLPEPGSLCVLASGLIGLAGFAIRRRGRKP